MGSREISLKNVGVLIFLTVSIRVALLLAVGPQFEADTADYLSVSRILHETGTFSEIDSTTGQLTPYAYRMPLFHAFVAGLMKVFGVNIAWPLAFANIFFSVCAVLFSVAIMSSVAPPAAALAAGYLMALNPNSIFNSVLLLTDSLFTFFCLLAILAGIQALKRRSAAFFLLWGAAIGVCAMVKPILKYYWVVPPLLIALPLYAARWKEKARYSALVILGITVFLGPWIARNRHQLGFTGLEVNEGVNTLISTIKFVRLSTPEQAADDPELAAVRDIVFASYPDGPLAAEAAVRLRLGLTPARTSAQLKRLGIEAILKNPGAYSLCWLRNVFNILTSPVAVMELTKRLSGKRPDYFPHILVALRTLDWETLAVNLAPRLILALLFFVCAPLGFMLLWRAGEPGTKLSLLLLLSVIGYTVGLTAMVSGYDRYRLPLDPLLLGLAAAWLLSKFPRKQPQP